MGNIRSKPDSIEQRRRHRSRARASFPPQDYDSCPALVSVQSIPNDASREQLAPPAVSSTTTDNAAVIPSTTNIKREPGVASRLRKFLFNDLKLTARKFSTASLFGEGGFGCVRDVTNDTSEEQPVFPGVSPVITSNTAINSSVSLMTTSNAAIASSISSKTDSNTTFKSSTSKLEEEIIVAPLPREFSLNDLKLATRNFGHDHLLGGGDSGSVFKGCIEENGTGLMVAVKRINCDWIQGHSEWLAEVKHLGQAVHPNLVKLIGYCIELGERLIVYEFMRRGSLEDHLFKGGRLPLSWSTRMKIALDAANGLAFLHEAERFYDFKTSKILLDADYNAKLSGIVFLRQGHITYQIMGISGHEAPEYMASGLHTAKSDVYSFGVVLLEILTGFRVKDKNRPSGALNLVKWARPSLTMKWKFSRLIDPSLEGGFPFKDALIASQLVARCLRHDAKLRPQMSDVVEVLKGLQDLPKLPRSSQTSKIFASFI